MEALLPHEALSLKGVSTRRGLDASHGYANQEGDSQLGPTPQDPALGGSWWGQPSPHLVTLCWETRWSYSGEAGPAENL